MMGESPAENITSFTASRHDSVPHIDEDGVIGAIAAIPIHLIDANPFQPRTQFNDESIEELCQSIRTNGVITPITVRKAGKRYQLISGERRLRASKEAGLHEIPAYIRMANDNEALEMALIENIQREELNAIDVALSYQALMDAYKYNQDELSKRVGKSRSSVANFLRLLKLPAEVQLYLKDNKISMGHARCIAGVEDEGKQINLAQTVVSKNLSVRELEELLRKAETKSDSTKKSSVPTPLPEWCKTAQKNLSGRLQTNVDIKCGKKGKGSIIIDYSSEEELQKIFGLLNE